MAKRLTTKNLDTVIAKTKTGAVAAMPNVSALLEGFLDNARKNYETDPTLETEKGIEIQIQGVGSFTILRTTTRNKAWTDAIRTRFAPHIDSKDEAFRKSLEIGIFADTVIIGMKTLDGTVVPYDDAAKRAMKELLTVTPDLFELLQIKANDAANFLKAYEAEAKN